ncbi:hypothetical protein CAL7716_104210 (plasmid) [Calothrix sp. PCC 7716]|nr:hypothetical protein CAL7716_104210 [Calothrix sp. PCC 7716]
MLGIAFLSSNTPVLATVYVSGSVNLVDGPNIKTVPGPNASASVTASTLGGNASASASDNGILSAVSTSENSLLITDSFLIPSVAVAGFNTGYIITGNTNNVSIPLTFNFGLNGSLNASSVPKRLDGIWSRSEASYTYNLFNSGTRITGWTTLESSSGIPSYLSSDSFGSGARLGARITPVLYLEENIDNVDIDGEILTPDDFRNLANDPGRSEAEKLVLNQVADTLSNNISLEQFSTLFSFAGGGIIKTSIIDAISAFGLLRLNIPSGRTGASLELGFNTNFFLDTNIKLQQQVQ